MFNYMDSNPLFSFLAYEFMFDGTTRWLWTQVSFCFDFFRIFSPVPFLVLVLKYLRFLFYTKDLVILLF